MSLLYILLMFGQTMFNSFKSYSSTISLLYNYVIRCFSYYYLLVLTLTLSLFVLYRVPYCYRPYLFVVFLLVVVFSRFMCLFLGRILKKVNSFFGGFVPVGTPLYICPVVCLAETIRYIIRPLVLILRPFIKISLGCIGTVAICSLRFNSINWILILLILFFYEVFVAVVHWYIVTCILSFSIDH